MGEISTLIADAPAFVPRRWAGRLLPRRPAFFMRWLARAFDLLTVVGSHDRERLCSQSIVGDHLEVPHWFDIGQLFVAVGRRRTDGGSWGSCILSGPPCGFVPDSKANPQVLSVDFTEAALLPRLGASRCRTGARKETARNGRRESRTECHFPRSRRVLGTLIADMSLQASFPDGLMVSRLCGDECRQRNHFRMVLSAYFITHVDGGSLSVREGDVVSRKNASPGRRNPQINSRQTNRKTASPGAIENADELPCRARPPHCQHPTRRQHRVRLR